MIFWFLFTLIIGTLFTIVGGRMLFSKQYAKKIAEKYFGRSDKEPYTDLGQWYDQYDRGGGIFALGVLFLATAIILFLSV